MARALIVGCGCRGRELGSELDGLGLLVRGTSRTPAGREAITAVGLEAAEADPDRPGTVLDLCGVEVLEHESDAVAAIHGPRLERLLERLVDTPVRGFVYEAVGSAPGEELASGREIVERAGETWHIPVGFLTSARDEPGWATRTAATVAGLLTA